MMQNTIDDVIEEIAPALLKHKGVVILSAALYLHGVLNDIDESKKGPDDIDLYFSTKKDADAF